MRSHFRLLTLLVGAACAQPFDLPPPKPVVLPGAVELTIAGLHGGGARASLPAAGLTTVAAPDGKVRFGSVPEGTYTLEVASSDGAAVARVQQVVVFAGQTTQLGTVTLVAAGSLRGKITAGTGSGNAGAVAFVPNTDAAALTGDDGTYRLVGLVPGRYVVHAKLAGYALGRSSEVTVVSGAETEVPTISLVPGAGGLATLEGRARAEEPRGLVGAGISVALEGTSLATLTGADGTWRLDGVPEGRYTVRFTRPGFAPVALRGVAAVAGAPTVLPDVALRSYAAADLDGDGTPDAQDTDGDGDGVLDAEDPYPRDPSEWRDADGDGVGDNRDNCVALPNLDQRDSDQDGVGDACELVGATNRAPVVVIEGPLVADEGRPIVLTARASDPDNDQVSLVARAMPEGAHFVLDSVSEGRFTFTPSFTQAGSHVFSVLATDGQLLATASRMVTVSDVPGGNLPPVVTLEGRTSVLEGDVVELRVQATDPEASVVSLSLAEGPTAGIFADHGDGTASFSWATGFFDQGTHRVAVRASDGETETLAEVVVAVADVNRPPSIVAPAQRGAVAGVELTFTVSASDPDGATPTLHVENAPAGAVLTQTGAGSALFRWTPARADEGHTELVFAASDGVLSVKATTRVDVAAPPNRAPILVVRGALAAPEGAILELDVEGTDPDGDQVLLLAQGLPSRNAAFADLGDGRGRFTFAPDFGQAGTYTVTFVATDGKAATLESRVVTVSDVPTVNQPPVVEVRGRTSLFEGELASLAVIASDPERAPLSLSLVAGPLGALFTDHGDGTGAFTWVASYSDAGTHTATFRAFDGTAATDATVTLVVANVNRPPTLNAPTRRSATVGQPLTFAVSGADPDGAPPALFLVGALPPGASFTDHGDGTAVFFWIPSDPVARDGGTDLVFAASDGDLSTQASTRVDVAPAPNRAPALSVVGPIRVDEGQVLTLALAASDPDGDSVVLLVRDAPANSTFVDAGGGSGSFVFRPDFTQAGSYTITFAATDGSAATLVPRTLTVNDVPGNTPPSLVVAGTTRVQESALIDLSVVASDPDSPVLYLSAAGAPPSAVFVDKGDGTGSFRWLTDYSDAGSYPLMFRASDGLTEVTRLVTLVVDDLNRAPVLSPLGDRIVTVGATLEFTVAASDPDGQSLVMGVEPAARPGMIFTDNQNGTASFSFTPSESDANSALAFTFTASDGQNAASKAIRVSVLPAGANRPPVWDPVAAAIADEGVPLDIDVHATDPDMDPITLRATLLPPGAAFVDLGGGAGRVSYTAPFAIATSSSTASVAFELQADDGRTTSALSFDVTVRDKNRAPVVTAQADLTVGDGSSVTVVTSAYDPDGNALTYLYSVSPSLPLVQGTGPNANRVIIQVPVNTVGTYTVSVTVRDTSNAEGTDQFQIFAVRGHFHQLPADPPQPSIVDGALLYDWVNDQLVMLDYAQYPDRAWFMSLQSDPQAQVWREKIFASYPQILAGGSLQRWQAIFADPGGVPAIYLFRSDATAIGPNSDVWKLDLNQETWSLFEPINAAGCYWTYYEFPALHYDASSERIVCTRFYSVSNGAALDLRPSATNRWSSVTSPGDGNSIRSSTIGPVLYGSTGTKLYVLGREGTMVMRVIEVEHDAGSPGVVNLQIITPASSAPTWSDGGSMAVDANRKRILLYGGLRGSALTTDIWQFDLVTHVWTKLFTNTPAPPGRYAPRMQVVPWQNRLYVGGGCERYDYEQHSCLRDPGSVVYHDLWEGLLGPSNGGF